MKSYTHLNFSRASVVQFLESRYIMRLNRTSVWKVMTIWISRELPLFNFERHDILCPRIGHPCEKLWPLEFSRASVIQFRVSRYIMSLNWTSMWKVMPTWILESFSCRISSVSIYYAPESVFWVKNYDHFNFSRAFVVYFLASQYIMRLNRNPSEKLWPFEFLESFRC